MNGRLSGFSPRLFAVAGSFALLMGSFLAFVLWNVPEHRILQAGIYFVIAVAFGIGILFVWMRNFQWYVICSYAALLLIPFFEMYLAPFVGNDLLRIAPQLFLIFLALVGYVRSGRGTPKRWLEKVLLAWGCINAVSLIFSKNSVESLPGFLVGVIGPVVYGLALSQSLLKDSAGFRLALNAFVLSVLVYIFFTFFFLMFRLGTVSASTTLDMLYSSGFGGEFARGPYGSNAVPGYTAFILPILLLGITGLCPYLTIGRFLSAIAVALISIMILLIGSRGGIGVLLCYFGVAFWLFFNSLKSNRSRHASFQIPRMLAAIVLIFVPVFYFLMNPDYLSFLQKEFWMEQEIGITPLIEVYRQNIRMIIWTAALQIARENWLTGVGLGNVKNEMYSLIGYNFDSHNVILDVFAEMGLFGGLLILCILFICLKRALKMGFGEGNESIALNMALCLGMVIYLVFASVLTGGKLVNMGEVISGFGSYLLFFSVAFQDYLWRQHQASKTVNMKYPR